MKFWEYSQYIYFCSLGVLPKGLFYVSGSTPKTVIFALWEYSQKAYFLSVGVIVIHFILLYRADIKVLGVLPILLFFISGSTPKTVIFTLWEYSQKAYFLSLGVLPKLLFLLSGHNNARASSVMTWLCAKFSDVFRSNTLIIYRLLRLYISISLFC